MSKFQELLEVIGLDFLPFVFGKSLSDENHDEKLKDIDAKLGNIDNKKIDDALVFSKELLDQENERGNTIEQKAQSLLGNTGIATAFVAGISTLLPENILNLPNCFPVGIIILVILIVIALIMTILLAFKAVTVGRYRHMILDIEDVYNMQSTQMIEIKKDRLVSIIHSYNRNRQIHDDKATYVIGAQKWFRNAVFLFLVLAIALSMSVYFQAGMKQISTVSPLPTYTTQVTNTPALTQTAVITITKVPSTSNAIRR